MAEPSWAASSTDAIRTTSWFSSIPYLRCHHSSVLCTVGISSKLCSGTGEGTIHSRLRASHGSGPGAGRSVASFFDFQMFQNRTSTEAAMRNDPIVATMFQNSKPNPAE